MAGVLCTMLLVEAEDRLLSRGHHCRGPRVEDERVSSMLTRHLLAENVCTADEATQNFHIL